MRLTDPGAEQGPLLAVLAGGLGRRIGGRKHAVMLGGRPLIAYPLAAARQAGLGVVIVGKEGLEEELAGIVPGLGEGGRAGSETGIGAGAGRGEVGLLLEPQEPHHPLCGILRALARAGPAGVVAVGCDMPFLTGPLLTHVAQVQETAVPLVAGALEPFPGRYRPEARMILERTLREEGPMREALVALSAKGLCEEELAPFGDPRRLCFSVNSNKDLLLAEEWLRGGRSSPLP